MVMMLLRADNVSLICCMLALAATMSFVHCQDAGDASSESAPVSHEDHSAHGGDVHPAGTSMEGTEPEIISNSTFNDTAASVEETSDGTEVSNNSPSASPPESSAEPADVSTESSADIAPVDNATASSTVPEDTTSSSTHSSNDSGNSSATTSSALDNTTSGNGSATNPNNTATHIYASVGCLVAAVFVATF